MISHFWQRGGIFFITMATLGKVDEFDASKEEWPQYKERLTHFFQANEEWRILLETFRLPSSLSNLGSFFNHLSSVS